MDSHQPLRIRHYRQVGELTNVNNVYAWPFEAAGRAPSHAVTIIGTTITSLPEQERRRVQGALLLVNSWGTDWGVSPANIEAGFMWLGYEAVLTYKKLEGQAYAVARSETISPRCWEPLPSKTRRPTTG